MKDRETFVVVHRGTSRLWKVVSTSTGRVLGSHQTKARSHAEKILRRLERLFG